ncbi:MAG: phytanoyl-CoA dioxygenase family protein [Myxococcota bacterium]|jgi:hypothetical protein|nr:phytanoyl-CoA dioxygenase family protein [Myxococcota bacterium]
MAFDGLTDSQFTRFRADGFLVVRNLFDAEEIGYLQRKSKADPSLHEPEGSYRDQSGRRSLARFWDEPPDDLYGLFMSCPRVVDTMARLLGHQVVHYHHKINPKEPHVGGAWEWHQDYGYWYTRGFAYPWMGACMIAIDPATRENGCLQVLRGSHAMGRLQHTVENGQLVADPDRVTRLEAHLERVHCELEPGDAVFFHCNLLHGSGPNTSDTARWVMILTYNAADNPCIDERYQDRCTPMDKVADSAIRELGRQEYGSAP